MFFLGSGPLSSRFDDALSAASDWHRDQRRKNGNNIPYFSHLLRVAGLALDYGASEDVAIAALLHDAVEDCGGLKTLATIRERFGEYVAKIVLETSDSTSADASAKAPWKERKLAYLAGLKTGLPEAALVSGCDKLDNATSLTRALTTGDPAEILPKFKSGPVETLWYYESVASILTERKSPVADELTEAVRRLRTVLTEFA